MSRDIHRYQAAYLSDYGFEGVMVRYRRRLLLERLHEICPRIVVEVGCGVESLYGHYLAQAAPVAGWIIVEPGEKFFRAASDSKWPNAQVIHGFLEESVAEIRRRLPAAPDLVICSSLLHEVPDAQALLAAMAGIMGEKTLLHINVPNAASFHRRLAKAMGMIPDLKSMSQRNKELQQHRIYDLDSLTAEVAKAGMEVSDSGGYFIKPFTHAQMEAAVAAVGADVLDGLYEMGKEFPALAAEIYVEARSA